jgi:hypothetical protein
MYLWVYRQHNLLQFILHQREGTRISNSTVHYQQLTNTTYNIDTHMYNQLINYYPTYEYILIYS